jgi:hypothetical protein
MKHAAKKWQEAPAPLTATVCLHLQRGSSPQVTWFLDDVPGGTSISVGADPSCDWQIRAACVPAHALSVLLLSGNLFVRSTCEGDVLLDGGPLGDSWVSVPDEAQLDVGFAQISITRGTARSAFDTASLGTLSYAEADLPALLVTAREHSLSTATRRDGSAWSEGALEPAREEYAERPSMLNAHSHSFAPSLLEEDRQSSNGLRFYVLAALATLFAYAGWVLALDRF